MKNRINESKKRKSNKKELQKEMGDENKIGKQSKGKETESKQRNRTNKMNRTEPK